MNVGRTITTSVLQGLDSEYGIPEGGAAVPAAGSRHRTAQWGRKTEQVSPSFPSTHQPRLCATRIFIELIY